MYRTEVINNRWVKKPLYYIFKILEIYYVFYILGCKKKNKYNWRISYKQFHNLEHTFSYLLAFKWYIKYNISTK